MQMLAGQWLGPGGHDDMAAVARRTATRRHERNPPREERVTDPRTSAAELRDLLWRAVTEGSEPAAVDVVTAGLDTGWDEEGLLLDVVAAVQV
ncbi:hypothetical protein OQI_35860, partial [Streptomyces pharetrae CZA14]